MEPLTYSSTDARYLLTQCLAQLNEAVVESQSVMYPGMAIAWLLWEAMRVCGYRLTVWRKERRAGMRLITVIMSASVTDRELCQVPFSYAAFPNLGVD
ncbi:unnamed protein product [Fusarium venenatum]|uniref:Uncharacterized protein n=1 Tax=Fusarium venenatum TaxID=56646 RepID=A0A2L2TER3_9HYPO|nr:uncharacterized protein FVRRES_11528 [Fusarium venenatum]CEI38837.1 unnamed protein product [Fusarium venenatum]